MSLNFEYLVTEIQGENLFHSLGDTLVTPLRVLFNGHSYCFIRSNPEDYYVCDHFYRAKETGTKVARLVKQAFAALALIGTAPLVLVGIVIKILSWQNPRIQYVYQSLIQEIAKDKKTILSNKLYLAPLPGGLDFEADSERVRDVDLTDLLKIWDNVVNKSKAQNPNPSSFNNGYQALYELNSQGRYEAVRSQLQTFINLAQNPNSFNYAALGYARASSEQLQLYLKVIIKELEGNTVSDDEKMRVIMELHDASRACSPTWVEIAYKNYKALKKIDTADQKVLRMIQDFKEEIILKFYNEVRSDQWHVIANYRYKRGAKFGLDLTISHTDGTYFSFRDASRADAFFYEKYNLNNLVAYIDSVVNKPKQNYDEDLFEFLKNDLRRRKPDWSERQLSNGIMEKYYNYDANNEEDPFPKLNRKGVERLLKIVNVIG